MSKTKAKSSSVVKPVARASSPPAATPSEAQRLAATILEVLGGMRSPPEAAQTLSISLPRYYQLEARALEGLLAALAPRPLGKQPSLENRVKQLEKQLETAHRQCARQEALVRVTQRALGLPVAPPSKAATAQGGRPGRKKRQPVVRALKAARTLHAQASAVVAPEVAGDSDAATVQPVASLTGAVVRS
jgi:hypothetical protein